jgi:hypothetical protein
MTAGCYDCGYSEHPAALDFDHVVGIKRCKISSFLTTGFDTLVTEIEKCVVRCSNCHRIKTFNER